MTNYPFMSQDFLDILSRVSRGTVQEKLQWIFGLYDINGDGLITKAEMLDVVTSIYAMVGRYTDPQVEENSAKEHVEKLFYVSIAVVISFSVISGPFNKEKTWLTNFITLVFFRGIMAALVAYHPAKLRQLNPNYWLNPVVQITFVGERKRQERG